jgi:hypothetical protein
MDLKKIFVGNAKYHMLGIAGGGAVLASALAAMTSFGPDFTPVARDDQRYNDNVDFYERSYLDGDFISGLLPLPEVSCPDGYAINEESWDSRFHLASWGTAFPQDANKPSLTLRFYSVGRCEKQDGDNLHVVPFDMRHTAEYNAYTADQILEAHFEENSRIGEIVVQKEVDGARWRLPAVQSHVLGPDERTFNGEMVYLTLERFRVKEHLSYRAPCTKTPDNHCY